MLRKYIIEGERYPRGYGMAWLDYQRNAAVCYPIPLNVVMRGVYLLWLFCLLPFGQAGLRLEHRHRKARLPQPDGGEA